MPVLIGEVIAQVESPSLDKQTNQPEPTQQPLPTAETEMLQTLAVLEERKQRLLID